MIEDELARVEAQRDRLAQALRAIRDTSDGWTSNHANRALLDACVFDPPEDEGWTA